MGGEIGAIEFGATETPPDELPPEDSFGSPIPPESSGDDTDSSGSSVVEEPAVPAGRKWLVLAKFFLDSGTEYDAALPVQHPEYLYEGRVLEWGYLDRSIPVPTGLPNIGDCRIRMADTDLRWRDILSTQTPRRRFIELRLMPEGFSEAAFRPIGTFEILTAEFAAGDVTIIGRDIHFAWVNKKLPNLINRTNFPDLAEGIDEAFMPVITGSVVSSDDNPEGVIPLPHIGGGGPGADRWGLASHPILRLVALYRKLPGDEAFTLVDGSEYVVTQDPPAIIEDIEYNLTFIDFNDVQEDGTEIRADVEGITARGPFFGMPAVIADSASGPLRNPVDFLIGLLYVVLKTETEFPAFNIDSFIAVRDEFELMTASGAGGSAADFPYLCDGVIAESMTAGAILSRFLTSFELDLYANRFGELELNLTLRSDPNRPVFDDGQRILRNTVRQRLADPTFNRLRYRYEKNYATDEWGSNEVFDNVEDQLALGLIEEDIVDFWFVRDPLTAADVIRRRASFVTLNSYRIELDLPAPEVRNDVELAKLIGVTHYGGIASGGYVNQEFKTTGITVDLDQLVTTVRGVKRQCCPLPRTIGALFPGNANSWTHNSRVGPFMAPPSSLCGFSARFCGIFRDKDEFGRLLAVLTNDMGFEWIIADEDGFEVLANPILSHDVQQSGNTLHVATQESNGRVSYHRFDLVSQKWVISNDVVNQPASVDEAPGLAFAPLGTMAKIDFSSITLGSTTTLFGWYKLYSGNPLNNYNPIWGSDGSNEIYYGSGNVSGKVEIVKGGTTIFRSSASVVADEWHFLVIVDDGAAITAYYDNVDMGNVIGGYTSLSGMSIARTNQGQNANNFRGWMDELGIFNRALNSTERGILYNSGAGIYGNTSIAPFNSGLSLGYHFDEGSGTTAADYSGNGKTGTITTSGSGWAQGIVLAPGSVLYDGNNFVTGAVSIAKMNPSGDLVVWYDATRETVSGTEYARSLARIGTPGNWGDAIETGRYGEDKNSLMQRVVAGLENRLHFFLSMSPGTSGTDDLEFQTRLGDGTLGSVQLWHATGLSGSMDRFYIGTYDTYLVDGQLYIALPVRVGGEGTAPPFLDEDSITPGDVTPTGPLIWYGSDSSLKPSYAVKFTDILHEVYFNFALFSPTFIAYDTNTNQAGPLMPVATPREMDANVWRVRGVNWLGTFLLTGDGIKFELLDTRLLPTSDTLTFEDWEDNLAAQDAAIPKDCD